MNGLYLVNAADGSQDLRRPPPEQEKLLPLG